MGVPLGPWCILFGYHGPLGAGFARRGVRRSTLLGLGLGVYIWVVL